MDGGHIYTDQFDKNFSDLYICIKLDHVYGGSFCIKEAFDDCFHQTKNSKNAIDTTVTTTNTNSYRQSNQANTPPLLYAFDSGDGYQPALMGCLWGFDGAGNDQVRMRTYTYMCTYIWALFIKLTTYVFLTHIYHNVTKKAKKTISYVLETSSIIWLGGAADGNEWKQPISGSFLGKFTYVHTCAYTLYVYICTCSSK